MKFGTVMHFGTQLLIDVQFKFVIFDNLMWQSYVAGVETTCWQLFRADINAAHFYFLLLQKLCQIT